MLNGEKAAKNASEGMIGAREFEIRKRLLCLEAVGLMQSTQTWKQLSLFD